VFRDTAVTALAAAERDVQGALEAATAIMNAAAEYKKGLKDELDADLAPFRDARGRTEDAYRGAVARLEIRHKRRERRAERDQVDWILMAMSALLRDRVAQAAGVDPGARMHPDLDPAPAPVASSVGSVAVIERARAELAEDVNRNVRLVLERALLRLPPYAGR
jgi:hypothetical protein